MVGNIGRMKFHKLRSISPPSLVLLAPLDITTLLVIIAPRGKGGENGEEEKGKKKEKKMVRWRACPVEDTPLNEWTLNPTPGFERARDL